MTDFVCQQFVFIHQRGLILQIKLTKFNPSFLFYANLFFYMTGCGFVVGCLGFLSSSKHSACRPLGLPAPVFYRLRHPPSFYSGVFPTAVINYFALYSEAGSLPRLKLRTAYAFFLTIRRSQRRIRSPLYKT